MKENMELERGDIAIGRDMEVDCDIGQEILAYVEVWFDADKKFSIHTADNDGTWLNLYARYNPFANTLRMECEIDFDSPESNQYFDYEPTAAEAQLIIKMLTRYTILNDTDNHCFTGKRYVRQAHKQPLYLRLQERPQQQRPLDYRRGSCRSSTPDLSHGHRGKRPV